MAGTHFRPQFSEDKWVFVVLKYTETGYVLETIKRFQRLFSNRNFHYCRRACSNINHTRHTYCNWPFLFVCCVLWFGNCPSRNLLIVSRILPVSVYFKTINTRPSSEKCGLESVPTIFVQFFCFLLHSSLPLLGFIYHEALGQLQNTWLCNTRGHPFVLMINREK